MLLLASATLFALGPNFSVSTGASSQAHELCAHALTECATSLQLTYPAPNGGEYDAHDLYQHYSAQLMAAGDSLKDGLTAVAAALPSGHPLSVDDLEQCGVSLSAAGVALGSEDFDGARTHLQAFEVSMQKLRLSDSTLHTYGFGVFQSACDRLETDLSLLGARRPAALELVNLTFLASTLPSPLIASFASPMAEVRDPGVRRMLRVEGEEEMAGVLALPTTLPAAYPYFAGFPGGANGLFESFASTSMSFRIYELGESLRDMAEYVITCETGGGTPDCPDLCSVDADCGGCGVSKFGFGMDTAGRLDPDEVEAVIGYGSVLIALASVSGPGLPGRPGRIMDAIELANSADDIDTWRNTIKALGRIWPSLYMKLEYNCCIVESCWDWGFCYFVTIYRNVCKSYETEWKRSPDPLGYWTGPVQGGGTVLQRAMDFAALNMERTFCPTACVGAQ
jgi:hypothetical protein